MKSQGKTFGEHLKEWRVRRRLSQLEFAYDAEISARHLSFLETGRSRPSREMILRLAEQLQIPLRDRNALLHAAGYAPIFVERPLDDPALGPARQAFEMVLKGHEPYPALAIDRHWNLVMANRAVAPLLANVAPHLLTPPINVLRVSLHPEGMARHLLNFGEWSEHILDRLRRQIAATADPVLEDLYKELLGYVGEPSHDAPADLAGIVIPMRLSLNGQTLSFLGTTTVFGTPVDVTLSELALECLYPADAETTAAPCALLNAG